MFLKVQLFSEYLRQKTRKPYKKASMKRIMNKIDYDFWWEKIADYAKLVGRTTARPVLLLYYVLRSPETPSSDKMLIVAALSYLILPIDLISAKRLPVIGWIDEAFSLVYAYKKVCRSPDSGVDNLLFWFLVHWYKSMHPSDDRWRKLLYIVCFR